MTPDQTAYRTDIDGLRAVAVLPVVAFHAGLHLVRGGFIGVDIFFVISGFLITQLLVKDIEGDRFSLVRFYDRRIRRILPALLPVLLVVFGLGIVYCLPMEIVDLSKSLIAAALSAANVYFWLGSGYFDAPALSKPLLHTWSLAVEEQFYIFWPLYLLLGHRWVGKRLLPATLLIMAASFVASVIGAFRFPDATFYLPFTRIWELAAGGILSMGVLPAPIGAARRNLLAACGLLLITGSVFLIDQDLPFPGLLALPPCLGAVLIILAGRDGGSMVARLLSQKPIVFIGLISYSLYLWHWPIVVFQKNYSFLAGGLPETANKLLIIAVSVAVGACSWKFIEQPFRVGRFRPDTHRMRQVAAVGTACAVAVAGLAWSAGGFPGRYSREEIALAKYLNYDAHAPYRYGRCYFAGHEAEWKFGPECLALSGTKKNYLLLGDSHAAELWFGLNATFGNANFLEASASDCFPTIVHSVSESHKCIVVLDRILDPFLLHHHLDAVLLVARWKPSLLANVSATLDWMKANHIPVILVGPTAVFDSPVPRLMVAALRNRDPALLQRHLEPSMRALDATMAQLAKDHGVEYISLIRLLCPNQSCSVSNSKQLPMIFDQEHYTADGSAFIARRLQDEKALL